MTVISHVWPGYTLHNVWSLTYKDWTFLRASADRYVREQQRHG